MATRIVLAGNQAAGCAACAERRRGNIALTTARKRD